MIDREGVGSTAASDERRFQELNPGDTRIRTTAITIAAKSRRYLRIVSLASTTGR